MDKSLLIAELKTKYGYNPRGAQLVADKLEKMNPLLADLFVQWQKDGVIPQFEIEGYSIQRLLKKHKMTPIAAFLTLDWLMREPNIALASLKKGKERLVKNQ